MKKGKLKINRVAKIFAAVALITIALTAAADATTLGTADIQNHNNSLSDIGQLWGGGLHGGFYYTGVYSWTNMGGTGKGTDVPDWGFCIELTQGAYNGAVDVIPLDEAPLPASILYGTPMGITKATYIRELWDKHFDPAWVTGPKDDTESKMAEAFGACLWEIIYEPGGAPGTWNVSTGTGFRASYIEKAAIANGWLSGLTGETGPFENHLYAISNASGQDYIVSLTPDVPEPATICMLGFGALSLVRRKK